MGISAIYGVGVYNQSRYGVVYITASSAISFLSSTRLIGQFPIKGNSKLDFDSLSYIGSGTTSQSKITIANNAHLIHGSHGKSSIVFSSHSILSAASSKIKGFETIKIINSRNNLEGNGVLKGSENFYIETQGKIFGQGEVKGSDEIQFRTVRSLTNAKKIKSYVPIFVIIKKSEITYTNKNPYYPTWNGKYIDLTSNNNLSSGYLDLLYAETLGPTDLPYEETNS